MCVIFTNEWQVEFEFTGGLWVTTDGDQNGQRKYNVLY